jgi:threonine/homoserine/homoserine lactone efflux protein
MPDFAAFSLFLTAAFLLSITPGPGILYVLARSLHGGRREGILSSLGLLLGGLVHVVAAAVGLSTVLMTSAVAFSMVKYAGAAYLIFLGVRILLSRTESATVLHPVSTGNPNTLIQGIITEALNPKTALFFLALIPQFVDPASGSTLLQFLVLGLTTAVLNFLADTVVAWFAGPIGQQFQANHRFQRRQQTVSGCTMIGLGAYVALAEQK